MFLKLKMILKLTDVSKVKDDLNLQLITKDDQGKQNKGRSDDYE